MKFTLFIAAIQIISNKITSSLNCIRQKTYMYYIIEKLKIYLYLLYLFLSSTVASFLAIHRIHNSCIEVQKIASNGS